MIRKHEGIEIGGFVGDVESGAGEVEGCNKGNKADEPDARSRQCIDGGAERWRAHCCWGVKGERASRPTGRVSRSPGGGPVSSSAGLSCGAGDRSGGARHAASRPWPATWRQGRDGVAGGGASPARFPIRVPAARPLARSRGHDDGVCRQVGVNRRWYQSLPPLVLCRSPICGDQLIFQFLGACLSG